MSRCAPKSNFDANASYFVFFHVYYPASDFFFTCVSQSLVIVDVIQIIILNFPTANFSSRLCQDMEPGEEARESQWLNSKPLGTFSSTIRLQSQSNPLNVK